ncbi:MAG: S-adenosylmethionine:tRNA ribosyltransferase-isomerase [Muribaculaceae bacterium]|nr:S-adenosylmethionine:tRNA ribosyltransferase-isomerase [Muribaculaceae bacterium]
MTDSVKNISIADFDYPLPDEKIAKHPLTQRDACKMLVRFADGHIEDYHFSDIATILPNDSFLIYNNTRVINARLRFRKGENSDGALIEIFCLEPDKPRDYAQNFASATSCSWICFVGNSKRWKDEPLKMMLNIDGTEISLCATRISKADNTSVVEFSWDNSNISFSQIISAAGEIPIPPYLNRNSEDSDKSDYQTVYSHIEGSVAAPTAGLHFTDDLLENISKRGIPRREVTLHVGAGTFQPVKSDTIGEHLMHSEFIAVDRNLLEELAETDRNVIAVGTTSVRTLESLYHIGCLISEGRFHGEVPQWYPYEESHPQLSAKRAIEEIIHYIDSKNLPALVASTRIIIAPGYDYRIVKGMVTNFHQPRSTLLLLVSAFTGGDWRSMYNHALESNYRFLSYGDGSLLLNY